MSNFELEVAMERRIKSLEAERDRLANLLGMAYTQVNLGGKEIDSLKAELETEKVRNQNWQFCSNQQDRALDLWKSKAEKLAEALRLCMVNTDLQPKGQALGPDYACEIAKEALAEFEKEV